MNRLIPIASKGNFSRAMLTLRALSYPALVVTFALIQAHPRDIFDVYSTHGSFAWLLLYFCWPWTAGITLVYVLRQRGKGSKATLLFALGLMAFYSIATIPVSVYASHSLSSIWGHPLTASTFWSALNFPFSLLFSLLQ